ncbi:uncharacterized protein LOC124266955 [Haliotis rubra]|uniref:uncharacterized protein LOC124266955 n=1 Tax=Haliotis rubra TaxID=36100 RepID=UPI001EE50716|nr:uncharacterized protein LOC124266955 [Haliotis rubra]
MPSHHCCVPGCTASTRKQQKVHKYPWLQGVTFFSFPNKIRASTLRRRWIKLVRREPAWAPNKYSRICSRHFLPGGDCPTLFPYNNFKMPSTLRCDSRYFFIFPPGAIESNTPIVSDDHHYVMKEAEKSRMCETGTQTDLTMSDIHNMNEDLKSKTEKLDDKETLFRDLFLETIVKDDEHVRFYTGLPSCTVLLGIFNILVSKCSLLNYWNGNAATCDITNNCRSRPGPSRKLTMYQEYILSLVRLRLGFLQYFLADVFGISKSRVSQIFATWITFMSQTFDNVLKWPSKLQVKKYMPLSFRQLYPRTRAIIDCTEFFFQNLDHLQPKLLLTVHTNLEILGNVYLPYHHLVLSRLSLTCMVVMLLIGILQNIQGF